MISKTWTSWEQSHEYKIGSAAHFMFAIEWQNMLKQLV